GVCAFGSGACAPLLPPRTVDWRIITVTPRAGFKKTVARAKEKPRIAAGLLYGLPCDVALAARRFRTNEGWIRNPCRRPCRPCRRPARRGRGLLPSSALRRPSLRS